ncbi:MAG: ABC transporter permease [Oscillospiraceae bacterium]|nr:ABC transporter permease [Oscillospiraceae bacterium]MCI8525369.1 ABC transporter permease [Oscillospiraceae bacterium]
MKKMKPVRLAAGRHVRFTTVFAVFILAVVLLAAFFPSLLTGYDPLEIDMKNKLAGPTADHWLGTDEYGRDLWCRIVYGARTSMAVGFGSALLAMLIGVPLGLVAGFYGGVLDSVIMRMMDAFYSFPSIMLALLLMTIFEPSATTLILTIAIVSFPAYGRIVRSSVLSIKEREFIEAARAFGARPGYLLFRAVLPNCASGIIVQFSLFTASAILVEASLSFLGLGIRPPAPAWGSMLSYAKQYIDRSTTYILVPAAAIFLVVLAINLLGDELREWLDPTRQK